MKKYEIPARHHGRDDMFTMNLKLIVLAVALTIFMPEAVQAKRRPHPRIILTRMVAEYAKASTYQDVGTLRAYPSDQEKLDISKNRDVDRAGGNETLVSFITYFKRPRMFRFEWQSSLIRASRNSVIWFDGQEAFSWSANRVLGEDRFVLKEETSFDSLVQNSMRPSAGMVLTVPSLLMANVAPYTFANLITDLEHLVVVREEVFDGETCYLIKGTVAREPWLLWIGRKSYLLRKARSSGSIGSFDERVQKNRGSLIMEEIHREIRINKRLSNDVFRYQPTLRDGDVDARP